uniref:C2H2-type domain-containing protein n=1 Tax=viral metagenome TaxID=1070528 RepID=A0A6C0KLX1_9ZZZZ
MSLKYNCEWCNFHTNLKGDFSRHLKTNKHKESTKSQPLVNLKSTFSQPKVNLFDEKQPHLFQCKYCSKNFKFKQSMYKHIKYTCKKNKDEDLKELARLFNEKQKQLNIQGKQMEKMQKQIDKLTNKLQIQNINQGTIHNTINIQLLNHMDTDYSHLTHNDYMACMKSCNTCVKTLIEKVHFNPEKPENMNIFLSNIKGKYVMVYKDNEWQIHDKKDQVDGLYDYNEMVLEKWYDDYKDKYPEIINSFQRYLNNKDENDVLNKVKDEILIMFYNKRKLVHLE